MIPRNTHHTNTHTHHHTIRHTHTKHPTHYIHSQHTHQKTHTQIPYPPHICHTRHTNIPYHTNSAQITHTHTIAQRHTHTHIHRHTHTLTGHQGKGTGQTSSCCMRCLSGEVEQRVSLLEAHLHLPWKPFWGAGPSEHKPQTYFLQTQYLASQVGTNQLKWKGKSSRFETVIIICQWEKTKHKKQKNNTWGFEAIICFTYS